MACENCAADLKSGKFNIYAQWLFMRSSLIVLLIFCITNLFNLFGFNLLVFIISIIGLFFAFIILLLEVPFCRRCCPVSDRITKIVETLEKNSVRGAGYVGMAVVMWLSVLGTASSLIVPALSLSFTGIFYSIAAFRKEERDKSAAISAATQSAAQRGINSL